MEVMVDEFREHDKVNDTSVEFSDDFKELQPYLALFGVLGILTNGPLLYILTKTNLHEALNALVLSLTLSNVLFVLFYLPFETVVIGSHLYPFSETVCVVTETVNTITFFLWPFTLIALIFRRIIIKPETPALPGGRLLKPTAVAIIAIWTSAVVLSVPTMISSHITELNGVEPASYCLPSSNAYYYIFDTIIECAIVVAVPLVAVVYEKRNRDVNAPIREQNDISNLVLVLVVVYAVFHVPSVIFSSISMLFDFHGRMIWLGIDSIRMCLYFLYPSACPVALFCANGRFRQLFKRHLLFWCKSMNQEPVVGREVGMQPLVHPTRTS